MVWPSILIIIVGVFTHFVIAYLGKNYCMTKDKRFSYTYFQFSKKRDAPVTLNIILNIVVPNIVMVILYDTYKLLEWDCVAERIWIFTVWFFVWRTFLICVILRRREFYKVKFEMGVGGTAIFVSLLLYEMILSKSESPFVHIDELREELGIAVVVAIYGIVKLAIGNNLVQRDIICDDDIKKYIERKFGVFTKRYGNVISITRNDNRIWMVLFSLMIFEDYNRGPLARMIEYGFLKIKKRATLGIMQVESKTIINSAESIKLAYDKVTSICKKRI